MSVAILGPMRRSCVWLLVDDVGGLAMRLSLSSLAGSLYLGSLMNIRGSSNDSLGSLGRCVELLACLSHCVYYLLPCSNDPMLWPFDPVQHGSAALKHSAPSTDSETLD